MEKTLDWLERREKKCREMAIEDPHNAEQFNASAERYRGHAEYVRILEAALNNLSNAAAIVFSKFEPKDGPGETAKALLKMELGLKD